MHACIHPSIHACMHACMHPSIHPSIHLSIHSCIHPSIHPSIHPCMHASIHSCIHPSVYPSIPLSIPLSIHTLMHPSIHLSIHLHLCSLAHHPFLLLGKKFQDHFCFFALLLPPCPCIFPLHCPRLHCITDTPCPSLTPLKCLPWLVPEFLVNVKIDSRSILPHRPLPAPALQRNSHPFPGVLAPPRFPRGVFSSPSTFSACGCVLSGQAPLKPSSCRQAGSSTVRASPSLGACFSLHNSTEFVRTVMMAKIL